MFRYLKHIDTYPPASAYISAFLTPSGTRFLLLHQPPQLPSTGTAGSGSSLLGSSFSVGGGSSSRASSSSIAANPTSPQTEEAVRQFMNEVYENYVKTAMNPFYRQGMEIRSPCFGRGLWPRGRSGCDSLTCPSTADAFYLAERGVGVWLIIIIMDLHRKCMGSTRVFI